LYDKLRSHLQDSNGYCYDFQQQKREEIRAILVSAIFLSYELIIARQHAMHAERDIAIRPSVRLPVRLSNAGSVSERTHISSHF